MLTWQFGRRQLLVEAWRTLVAVAFELFAEGHFL